MTSKEELIHELVNNHSLEECQQDLESLVNLISQYNKRVKIDSKGINKIFELNNKYTNNLEFGKHCGSCRSRVWKRVSREVHPVLKKRLDNED